MEENMVEVRVESDQPPTNGHQRMPAGNSGLFGVDELGGGGQGTPPSRDFMTAHVHDLTRLYGEAVLTKWDRSNIMLQEAANQIRLGHLDMSRVLTLGIAATIGVEGRGREDGVKVETMGARSAMSRARGFFGNAGKMFGMGGANDGTATPPQQPGGY